MANWEYLSPYVSTTKAPHIGHRLHLCDLCEHGECSLDEIKKLVRDPKYICKKCGRTAAKDVNLCDPIPL